MTEMQKRLVQYKRLTEVASLINSTLDHKEIIRRSIEATTTLLNAEAASLLLLDEATDELYFDVATGEKGEKVKKIRLKKGEGIASCVAEGGEPLIVKDIQSDPRFFKVADEVSGFTTRSIICTPVKSRDRIIGVLEGINKRDGEFDNEDLDLINSLSNYVAVAIENARLYRELKEAFYNTSEVLAETIGLRDPYTGGHTKRVKDYSIIIGRYMGLGKDDLENLELAAILHDIGKIGVRDEILHKQGRLEEEELTKMNMHSQYGAELLHQIKQLKDIIPGIRGHHERYDGNGYPDRLKDKEIPLIARIIAVVDTYDAMTTDRPYRKGLSHEDALKELKRFEGKQFDPEVVETFLQVFMNGEISTQEV